jgi:hypothetical protein
LLLHGCAAVLDQFEKLACFEVEVAGLATLLLEIDGVILYAILEFADREERRWWSHSERFEGERFIDKAG